LGIQKIGAEVKVLLEPLLSYVLPIWGFKDRNEGESLAEISVE
jgi:hypothetical protein